MAAREIIVVRALTDSDLGLFAAHRAAARSKQRAININAPAAERILSKKLYKSGGTTMDCICMFSGTVSRAPRSFSKVHKNWRLGGNKIEGEVFANIDSRDFIIIHSGENNDGSLPISIAFVSRATDRDLHARFVSLVENRLDRSMVVIEQSDRDFVEISSIFHDTPVQKPDPIKPKTSSPKRLPIPPMPSEAALKKEYKRSIRDKIRSPHILEQMLKVSSDLSGPAQVSFMDTVEQLASQLREVLIKTGRIINLKKNHGELWQNVAGKSIGFVDGGMANLSMLGSVPIAVRVGGYIVRPGDRSPEREKFIVLKKLINELYTNTDGGVYTNSFPDLGALRDAARISTEVAGAVRVLDECPEAAWIFLHGSLVSPASRYSDVMRDGKIVHAFPNFSQESLLELLSKNEPKRSGRETNFISVYLRQLQILSASSAIVCGVVERESHTTTVINAVLNSLNDDEIRPFLPLPPHQWKAWFRAAVDPLDDHSGEGQRITDPLLFRCVLEPNEALLPVPIDRNEMRRAPEAWKDKIVQYPKPIVSYLQPTEWNAPIRIEMFEKDRINFEKTATLLLHCSLLLPKYAFPVGLDIVDKFAKIPNWMSRPVNTHTAVIALKRAFDSGDSRLFDALRRMMCGSQREWLLRPGMIK